MLLLGLLNGFNSRIQENPALPSDVKTQIAAATEEGIPIVTTEQAHQALLDAGLTPAEADAVTADYGNAQLDALKTSMLAVAFLAVLSFWFTGGYPEKPESRLARASKPADGASHAGRREVGWADPLVAESVVPPASATAGRSGIAQRCSISAIPRRTGRARSPPRDHVADVPLAEEVRVREASAAPAAAAASSSPPEGEPDQRSEERAELGLALALSRRPVVCWTSRVAVVALRDELAGRAIADIMSVVAEPVAVPRSSLPSKPRCSKSSTSS